ncbi:hypothetical protein Cgig2_007771 [Carnegiea gigantea]|uniref:Uncharacterized protein n=1 Tax=Carnegiea gigantea TaxID=171969 RepID=A0A9Q1JHK4_9CARY|nr:hypothetical protein Cgig2_007771 [Carnegiea gigantea]
MEACTPYPFSVANKINHQAQIVVLASTKTEKGQSSAHLDSKVEPLGALLQGGTLRHAIIQEESPWIIVFILLTIRFNHELVMTSHETINVCGANVVMEGGAGITVQNVENEHSSQIGQMIGDSTIHSGFRTKSDGAWQSIMGSHHIWINPVFLSQC